MPRGDPGFNQLTLSPDPLEEAALSSCTIQGDMQARRLQKLLPWAATKEEVEGGGQTGDKKRDLDAEEGNGEMNGEAMNPAPAKESRKRNNYPKVCCAHCCKLDPGVACAVQDPRVHLSRVVQA